MGTLLNKSKIIAFIRSLLFIYIISGLFLFLLAFLMLKVNLPGAVINGGVIVVYVLSCFIGGFIMGKNGEQRRFIWGLVTGILYFLVLFIISAIVNGITGLNLSGLASTLLICGFSGMLGGMLS